MIECAIGIKGVFDARCNRVGLWLDHHIVVYKVVLIVNHIFRALMVATMLAASPWELSVTAVAILIPSLLYRVAVERFCVFRFTLSAWAGGVAMAAASHPVGVVAIGVYAVTILAISHYDGEARRTLVAQGRSCCSSTLQRVVSSDGECA